MKRTEVYAILDGERDYQETKWHLEPKHSPIEWLVYMQDYLTQTMNVATRTEFSGPCNIAVMKGIRKITAMGIAAMEQNGCKERT